MRNFDIEVDAFDAVLAVRHRPRFQDRGDEIPKWARRPF
jgi:hypothetical protein